MSTWGDSRGTGLGGRAPISPQLGRRVAIVGGVAVALFAIILFRLWFLQVLEGQDYLKEAQDNRVRVIPIAPPRGQLLDRDGTVLVDNRSGTVVQLLPNKLPAAERTAALDWGHRVTVQLQKPEAQRHDVDIPAIPDAALEQEFRRLAPLVNMSVAELQKTVVEQITRTPYAPIRLKVGVSETLRNFLLEHADRFPSVGVQTVFLRTYPEGNLAAQLLGTVGAVSAAQLKEKDNRDIPRDSVVGQSGLEAEYDQYLRGTAGQNRVIVDASGQPKSSRVTEQPVAGRSVQLSLDLGLQKAGQAALKQYLAGPSFAGAFVALDPRNGEVLAMGSAPTFNPTDLTKTLTDAQYKAEFGEAAGAPLINRAIRGEYATGSIFKPITALAGLKAGTLDPNVFYDDHGFIKVGPNRYQNAGNTAYGPVNLVDALRVSSDTYFYVQGLKLNGLEGQVLQKEARSLGLGHKTGIDLPGEFPGTVPDRAWRANLNRLEAACEKEKKVAHCGFADGTNRPWSSGDNLALAVGQGDLQATPLQMAVTYSALENGGTVVQPHLGLRVVSQSGSVDQSLPPGSGHKVAMPAGYDAILRGLHEATSQSGGTSQEVFGDWPQGKYPVYGKTGTAERAGKPDQSWFAAFVKDPQHPIVIVTTVEDGGWGAAAAAPATCLMLKHWYNVKQATCAPGKNQTR